MANPNELVPRFTADPVAFRNQLLAWFPEAPADEMVATRHQLVDIAAYVKRYDAGKLLEALRCARLTEWEMAHRWPPNPDGVRRTDSRPSLASDGEHDRQQWQRIYDVGRADRERILVETDLEELTQAAVIRWTRGSHVGRGSSNLGICGSVTVRLSPTTGLPRHADCEAS